MTKKRNRKRDTAAAMGVYDAERDILDLYLHEVSKSKLLTAQEEIVLAHRIAKGHGRLRRPWRSGGRGRSPPGP